MRTLIEYRCPQCGTEHIEHVYEGRHVPKYKCPKCGSDMLIREYRDRTSVSTYYTCRLCGKLVIHAQDKVSLDELVCPECHDTMYRYDSFEEAVRAMQDVGVRREMIHQEIKKLNFLKRLFL